MEKWKQEFTNKDKFMRCIKLKQLEKNDQIVKKSAIIKNMQNLEYPKQAFTGAAKFHRSNHLDYITLYCKDMISLDNRHYHPMRVLPNIEIKNK